jgi:CHAD domain-containing protein
MSVTEREIKLGAAETFSMPSLDGLVAGITAKSSEAERLSTTYFDTDDLRLARWGMSLRHRAGQGWTVKLPTAEAGLVLVRPEITFEGNGEEPPGEVVDLVRAVVRSSSLETQTRLNTIRQRIALHDGDGSLVADVFDDEVSVLKGQHPVVNFRELEVEITERTPPDLLDALVDQLRRAGADAPDPTPKYIRSLGPRAALSAEVPIAALGPEPTCGDVVRRAIAKSVVRLIEHDAVMRLDTDPEGVHQARVATRRLRSDLRTFRSLVDPGLVSSLRDELGWLAGVLGGVRDGDVLLERIRRSAAQLPESSCSGADRVLGALAVTREEARDELFEAIRSDRYVELLDLLVAAAIAPALRATADLPARDALPSLVRDPWRLLEKRAEALGSNPADDALHDIRVRTKRVRYAAEAVAPVVGDAARAFARAAADLQEVLGDLNDAVVAEEWLRNWAQGSGSPSGVFAAGELASLEHADAQRSRAHWRKAWRKLASPKLRSWM